LETLAAEHWTSLRGLERYSGFTSTLRAIRARFDATSGSALTLGLAGLAAFRLVFKSLIEKEMLFTGGENKIRTAVHTL
jgi:hypothetical protein